MTSTTQPERSGRHAGLSGKRVLLVEDDHLIALVATDLMEDHGITVVGPVATLQQAMSCVRTEALDAAVLDVNLGADTSFAAAGLLKERGIPLFYTTAHNNRALPEVKEAAFLAKPYGAAQFIAMLETMLDDRAS